MYAIFLDLIIARGKACILDQLLNHSSIHKDCVLSLFEPCVIFCLGVLFAGPRQSNSFEYILERPIPTYLADTAFNPSRGHSPGHQITVLRIAIAGSERHVGEVGNIVPSSQIIEAVDRTRCA